MLNKTDRGSSCIPPMELNPRLFNVNLHFGDTVRLKEPGSQEAFKCSLLPAFGVSPPGGADWARQHELFKFSVSAAHCSKRSSWGSPESQARFSVIVDRGVQRARRTAERKLQAGHEAVQQRALPPVPGRTRA